MNNQRFTLYCLIGLIPLAGCQLFLPDGEEDDGTTHGTTTSSTTASSMGGAGGGRTTENTSSSDSTGPHMSSTGSSKASSGPGTTTGSMMETTSAESSSSASSSSTGMGTGIFCGMQEVTAVGYAFCYRLSSVSLAAGTYATMTVSNGSPAASDPGNAYTPGCISQQPATANDMTDPSVYCEAPNAMEGDVIYMGLKSYASNVGNPPLPFMSGMCDLQTQANGKCRGTMETYKNGVLVSTFQHPPATPYAYFDADQANKLMQLEDEL